MATVSHADLPANVPPCPTCKKFTDLARIAPNQSDLGIVGNDGVLHWVPADTTGKWGYVCIACRGRVCDAEVS